jgi:hypothetical protein
MKAIWDRGRIAMCPYPFTLMHYFLVCMDTFGNSLRYTEALSV